MHPAGRCTDPGAGCPPDERLVLMRMLGRVQERATCFAQATLGRLQACEAEIVRLRGQLLVAQTAAAWGLPWSPAPRPCPRAPAVAGWRCPAA